MDMSQVLAKPATVVESGPAAGVVGAANVVLAPATRTSLPRHGRDYRQSVADRGRPGARH